MSLFSHCSYAAIRQAIAKSLVAYYQKCEYYLRITVPLRIAVSFHSTGTPHTSMPLFILLTSEGWKTYSNLVLWHGLELNHICTNIFFLIPIFSWASWKVALSTDSVSR